jgi:hypothetical protein
VYLDITQNQIYLITVGYKSYSEKNEPMRRSGVGSGPPARPVSFSVEQNSSGYDGSALRCPLMDFGSGNDYCFPTIFERFVTGVPDG